METIIDVLNRHPNFNPRNLEDIPTIEEIYAANTMTYDEVMREIQLERMRYAAEMAREHGRSEEQRASELARRVERSGIPARYHDVPIDLTHVREINAGTGVYIYGEQETGKTWLACAMLKGWMSQNQHQGLFVTSADLLTEIAATYSTYDTEKAVLERYSTCALLVVDDLGKENPTDTALTKLWQLVNARYSQKRPTIVTTQYQMERLGMALGRKGGTETSKAIIRRLRETCVPVLLEGRKGISRTMA